MEIFMRNINWSYNQSQVTSELALILHGQNFTHLSPSPINFHLLLHRDKKNRIRPHSGSGALTLPTPEIANQFLALYGSPTPSHVFRLGGKIIQFALSKNPAGRADVVESIRLLPYVDPQVKEERDNRVARLNADRVLVSCLQFGWECRDGVFSIEWEESCEGRCRLGFDENRDRRQLRITLVHESQTFIIAFPYSYINSTTIHRYLSDNEQIIFFSLNTSPTYELDAKSSNLRQRLSHLPLHDHQRVAPYTSCAIRLVCSSPQQIQRFRDMSRVAQLQHIYDYEYPVVRRELFSADAFEKLEQCLRRFNWCVAFQILALVYGTVLDVREALDLVPQIWRLVRDRGKLFAASTLRKFGDRLNMMLWGDNGDTASSVEQCFLNTLDDQIKLAGSSSLDSMASRQPIDDGNICDAFHVIVTPTQILLEGPFPERSNRVTRQYDPQHQESFLRVSFADEGKLRYRFDREVDGPAFIRSRVGRFLLQGLTLAQRDFKFLAYSQSALKEHSVWFVKAFRDSKLGLVNAKAIIRSLGTFDNLAFDSQLRFCPARYAARLSQAFTATDVSVTVEAEEVFELKDITTPDNKYQFTDGVGTISPDLAREISLQLKSTKRRKRPVRFSPKAFQIRFMGSKGMLSVDHKLSGRAICLRPSMIKFESPNSREIEIARSFDRPGAYYLNRPLIMLLEGLGVEYEAFKKFQDAAVQETRMAAQSLRQAAAMLESYGLGASYRLSSILLSMEKLYISSLPGNAFYEKMLECAINHVLRQLKNHARIPIPNAWTLVGVADVHKSLGPGEIFACVKPVDGRLIYLEGPILISRSPTIHPGDAMVVQAIGKPPGGSCFEREPLPNTVVFSVLGERPIPSCLGGGDLDGDVYNLIPLDQLPEFWPKHLSKPASYNPAPKKLLDRPSTMDDVAEFVMEYISSDVVGIIAINWLIIADQSQRGSDQGETSGIFDQDCLLLAELHSDAVDYPKSGQPVALNRIPKLKHRMKPDWNAPETVTVKSADYYESPTAIGRLFREIDLPIEQPRHRHYRRHRRQREPPSDLDDVVDRMQNFDLDDAQHDPFFSAIHEHVQEYIETNKTWPDMEITSVGQLFIRYAEELQGICVANTLSHAHASLLTEEEAMIGTIVQKSSQPRKRKDMMSKLRESTDILLRGIREALAGNDDLSSEASLERAWLAWQLSITKGKEFGAQSFGWVALGAIFEAIKEIQEQDDGRSRQMWR